MVTGGSDYHGFYSQHNYELGSKSLNKEDLFKFRLALGGYYKCLFTSKNVGKSYGQVKVLKDISIDIEKGSLFAY